MALINMFNVPITAYDIVSGSAAQTVSANLRIPVYSDRMNVSGVVIVNTLGLITNEWDNVKTFIQDFEISTFADMYDEFQPDYFPGQFMKYNGYPVYKFEESGYFVRGDTRPWAAYATLDDCINGRNELFRVQYTAYEGYLHTGGAYLAFITANDDFSVTTCYSVRVSGKRVTFSWRTTDYVDNANLRRLLTGSEDGKPGKLETPDPYGQDPGGTTGTGGGTGTFDGTGDDIDIPGLPTLSAVDTGFITLFNPSAAQLKNLANYMWSTGFDLDTFKKLFADPMDCILGLSIVPVSVPNGGGATVNVGNISTGVTMTKAASQYVEVDCGTLNIEEYWGAYLDYDPYTQAEIYLPYIGTHPLKVDDIMGKAVRVVYHVDILSGACTAFVKCGGSVLYEFIGQCSSSIPITGNDWTNVINGVISIAGAIGTMVATGGASAPMSAGVIAATAVNNMFMKPNVEKSGSMSGTGGMLALQTPYLILTRPHQALPTDQNIFMGYPSFITENLSEIGGYTEIESIHLEGISGTEQEISEIETLLKGGVIF